MGPGFGQSLGNGFSVESGAAGDDRYLAGEIQQLLDVHGSGYLYHFMFAARNRVGIIGTCIRRAWVVTLLLSAVTVFVPAAGAEGRTEPQKTNARKLAAQYGWPYVAGHPGISRQEVVFPRIQGFWVIKADLHIHTIYSDGQVLPETRVWEAWRDGLDLLVITDHPEYLTLALPQDRDRAYGRALPLARALGLLLVRGAELTTLSGPQYTDEDSDHVVAFIQDEGPFFNDFDTAVRSARDQGAVIIWAHPGPRWARDAKRLLELGWLDGIELRNSGRRGGKGIGYHRGEPVFSRVMDWCLKHDLAVIASSDAHWPIDQMVDRARGERRDMTLVLAERRDEKAIRDAIKARRTLAYFAEMIWGREEWLQALAESALAFSLTPSVQRNRKRHFLSVANSSSFPFHMKVFSAGEEMTAGHREFRITERGQTVVPIKVNEGETDVRLVITVTNLLSGAARPLVLERSLQVPGEAP